jgi:antirestriction protein ArdC
MRRDEIRIPTVDHFHSLEDMHATILHECGHASGHMKRLSRPHMHARFGSAEYSREELRAELASAFMQGLVGLQPGPTMIESHASYLSSWLEVLRGDKGEIFRAAADAQRICDYLSERALQARPRVNQETSPEPDPKPVLVAKAACMQM